MNVLSLFDGMSCGQIALAELNIQVETYYASEIDKHAIRQTQLNFPNTIQLGSVVDVDVSKLKPINMLIGGSPCQSFSFAGKRKGMSTKCEIEITTLDQYLTLKKQGFEFEGQSYLFWEYMRVLTDIRKYNPNVVFLLENVNMSSKWKQVISIAIGVMPVKINSSLVSAQSRNRLYWTNIGVEISSLFGEKHTVIPIPIDRGILLKDILEETVSTEYYLNDSRKKWLFSSSGEKCLKNRHGAIGGNKSICLTKRGEASWNCQYVVDNNGIRVLTPREWARLQTIPDWYSLTESDKYEYEMIGNGWTVEVIKHIFSFLNKQDTTL